MSTDQSDEVRRIAESQVDTLISRITDGVHGLPIEDQVGILMSMSHKFKIAALEAKILSERTHIGQRRKSPRQFRIRGDLF